MDVGATLRRARQEKRLTLDQLSRATKISKSNLKALEDGDFERLPAAVYTRGFLRAYAREVGLDPHETVELYMQQVEEAFAQPPSDSEPIPGETADASSQTGRASHQDSSDIPLRIQIDFKNLPRPAAAATALVVFLAVIAAFLWRGGTGSEEVTSAAAQPDAEPAAATAAAPSDAVQATRGAEELLRIELRTNGLCWVSATGDGAPVLTRLMQAGESETIDVRDGLVIRIGDPSTIAITINGEPVQTLGQPAVPVTVRIDRQNYRGLLAS
jgi:cytoskeleton protein RodZ